MLKLMYITNRTDVASIAENAGVDRIFVDMEYIGKSQRQGGKDTVQNRHTVEDAKRIKGVLRKAELMTRCNPIHEGTEEYSSSKEEIDAVIDAGSDIIMLPFFKTVDEVKKFEDFVGGRAKTIPLVETPEAVDRIDEILKVDGIDEIFVGLNDLSLGYGKKFMFELVADGTVERLADKFKNKGIKFGFGGIASLGKGLLPSELVVAEHYRLGSSGAILSRSFCDANKISDAETIRSVFDVELSKIRDWESKCATGEVDFESNSKSIADIVKKITENAR